MADMSKKQRFNGRPQSDLTFDDVREIRRLSRNGVTRRELGERYHLSKTSITKIVNYQNYAHVDPDLRPMYLRKMTPGCRYSDLMSRGVIDVGRK